MMPSLQIVDKKSDGGGFPSRLYAVAIGSTKHDPSDFQVCQRPNQNDVAQGGGIAVLCCGSAFFVTGRGNDTGEIFPGLVASIKINPLPPPASLSITRYKSGGGKAARKEEVLCSG